MGWDEDIKLETEENSNRKIQTVAEGLGETLIHCQVVFHMPAAIAPNKSNMHRHQVVALQHQLAGVAKASACLGGFSFPKSGQH